VLHVITVEKVGARQPRRVNDHRIPEGNSIQPVQFNGRDHIPFHEANHSGTREQLNLLLRRFRIDDQFPGCRGIVFLQDLNGNNQQTGALIIGDEPNCARLPGWSRSVVGVDEDVRVEECRPVRRRS
jgi:hypothetical protein